MRATQNNFTINWFDNNIFIDLQIIIYIIKY